MTPQIWLISNPTKPTHRRLSFKNDMTTFEKGLGWVAELVNGDVVALPVHEAAFFSRESMAEHSDLNRLKTRAAGKELTMVVNGVPLGVSQIGVAPKSEMQEQSEPTRHELQANGTHPAPCARFCEANAFRIAERGYQRKICELSKKLALAKQEQDGSLINEGTKSKQEPVAWLKRDGGVADWGTVECGDTPLYTTPPQRKPLTDENIFLCVPQDGDLRSFARAIEAAHSIKE